MAEDTRVPLFGTPWQIPGTLTYAGWRGGAAAAAPASRASCTGDASGRIASWAVLAMTFERSRGFLYRATCNRMDAVMCASVYAIHRV